MTSNAAGARDEADAARSIRSEEETRHAYRRHHPGFCSPCSPGPALAQDDLYGRRRKQVADEKAVFATVESANVVPARARIGGTVAELSRQGRRRGQAGPGGRHRRRRETGAAAEVARRADRRAGGAARPGQDRSRPRAEDLFSKGTIPKARLDEAQHRLQRRQQRAPRPHRRAFGGRAAARRGQGAGADRRPRAARFRSPPAP